MQSPQGILEKVKMLPKLAEIGSFFPKIVRSGDCQEVVHTERLSLLDFPILQCWPQDGGRYITWPMVITKNPETGKRNTGCYRMQVFDERTTGMHWQTQKHGAEHFRSARAKNREGKIDVAVAIGADPATCLAGILARSAGYGRISVFGISAARAGGTGALQDGRSGSSGQCGDRAGRICESRGTSHRRAVWRPHRLLFARRRIPGLPCDLHHASQRPSLPDHDRGAAAAGGLFHRPRDRARLPARDEDAASGNRGRGHARRRNLSEPDDRRDPQKLSRGTPARR